MKNFIQPGQVITVRGQATPIVSGNVYDMNGIIGVATGSLSAAEIASGKDEWEMALGGIYSFPPAGGYAPAFGDDALWVNANSNVAAAGDIAVGKVMFADATEVHILLNNKGEASGY